MGILRKVLKTAIHTATTPLDLLADAFTLGGEMVDRDEPFIVEKGRKIGNDIKEVGKEIDKL